MMMEIPAPQPVLFNVWKHHAGYAINQLKVAKKIGLPYFAQEVKAIGNNQMDLYSGAVSPAEIGKEILSLLKDRKVCSPKAYQSWITQTETQYRLLTLKDRSVWTLLWSPDTERYIHIHPARYSPHTLRVRGTLLKTVILSYAYATIEDKQPDLSLINQVRKVQLDLSPVQHLNPEEGLGKILQIFHEMMHGKGDS